MKDITYILVVVTAFYFSYHLCLSLCIWHVLDPITNDLLAYFYIFLKLRSFFIFSYFYLEISFFILHFL